MHATRLQAFLGCEGFATLGAECLSVGSKAGKANLHRQFPKQISTRPRNALILVNVDRWRDVSQTEPIIHDLAQDATLGTQRSLWPKMVTQYQAPIGIIAEFLSFQIGGNPQHRFRLSGKEPPDINRLFPEWKARKKGLCSRSPGEVPYIDRILVCHGGKP
jgi:hypothetical protein